MTAEERKHPCAHHISQIDDIETMIVKELAEPRQLPCHYISQHQHVCFNGGIFLGLVMLIAGGRSSIVIVFITIGATAVSRIGVLVGTTTATTAIIATIITIAGFVVITTVCAATEHTVCVVTSLPLPLRAITLGTWRLYMRCPVLTHAFGDGLKDGIHMLLPTAHYLDQSTHQLSRPLNIVLETVLSDVRPQNHPNYLKIIVIERWIKPTSVGVYSRIECMCGCAVN